VSQIRPELQRDDVVDLGGRLATADDAADRLLEQHLRT